jgi:hypothetical protein
MDKAIRRVVGPIYILAFDRFPAADASGAASATSPSRAGNAPRTAVTLLRHDARLPVDDVDFGGADLEGQAW